MNLPESLAVRCHCTDVIRELERLADMMELQKLTFTADVLWDNGESSGCPNRVFNLAVNCPTCLNFRQVLTPYGKQLARIAREEEASLTADVPYLTPFRVDFPVAREENLSPDSSDV